MLKFWRMLLKQPFQTEPETSPQPELHIELSETSGPPLPTSDYIYIKFPTPITGDAVTLSILRDQREQDTESNTVEAAKTVWNISLKGVRCKPPTEWKGCSCDLFVSNLYPKRGDKFTEQNFLGGGWINRYQPHFSNPKVPFHLHVSLELPLQQVRDLIDRWTILVGHSPDWWPLIVEIRNPRYSGDFHIYNGNKIYPHIQFDVSKVHTCWKASYP
jgi:hypothetical protein